MGTAFEQYLNARLGRDHVKVHVAIIPVARDQLVPALSPAAATSSSPA
jgi:hypothetical protein